MSGRLGLGCLAWHARVVLKKSLWKSFYGFFHLMQLTKDTSNEIYPSNQFLVCLFGINELHPILKWFTKFVTNIVHLFANAPTLYVLTKGRGYSMLLSIILNWYFALEQFGWRAAMVDNVLTEGTQGYMILMWLAMPTLSIFLVLASWFVVHYSEHGGNKSHVIWLYIKFFHFSIHICKLLLVDVARDQAFQKNSLYLFGSLFGLHLAYLIWFDS